MSAEIIQAAGEAILRLIKYEKKFSLYSRLYETSCEVEIVQRDYSMDAVVVFAFSQAHPRHGMSMTTTHSVSFRAIRGADGEYEIAGTSTSPYETFIQHMVFQWGVEDEATINALPPMVRSAVQRARLMKIPGAQETESKRRM